MRRLTWNQVNAWRLSHHGLSPRFERRDFLQAASRTCGIQAQVISAAELATGARVDGTGPRDVQAALWEERTLIKTWAMRGTLHLITAEELPLFVAARSVLGGRNWVAYFEYYGLTAAQLDEFVAAVPRVLGAEPMTREELATAVADFMKAPELGQILISSSWGSLWKPSAWRGDLCFGPNQGRNVTFVRPAVWSESFTNSRWHSVEPQEALREIARRYLQAYGPATPEDFALWWWGGGGVAQARKLFHSLGDEVEEVDVEGWQALALRSTLEQMEGASISGCVRLLPLFDAYVLGTGRNLEPILPMAHKSRVFRPQGWISAVVLVDGRMEGMWEYELKRVEAVVKVQMFAPTLKAWVKRGIEAEAERLGDFLNSKVKVEFDLPG